uniref:(northern house mosquito) hypothetical protein n=1 Tax=Culex pipiens TaxID=7175 RepID=A0A8D8GJW3_CULPI
MVMNSEPDPTWYMIRPRRNTINRMYPCSGGSGNTRHYTNRPPSKGPWFFIDRCGDDCSSALIHTRFLSQNQRTQKPIKHTLTTRRNNRHRTANRDTAVTDDTDLARVIERSEKFSIIF